VAVAVAATALLSRRCTSTGTGSNPLTICPWDDQLYIYAYVVRPTGIADYGATRPSTDFATARRSD